MGGESRGLAGRGGSCGTRLDAQWACRRGRVSSGAGPQRGRGPGPGGRTLSTRPSGLSSVARAMVFTCSVYRVWGSRSCERPEVTGAEGRRPPGPAPSGPAPLAPPPGSHRPCRRGGRAAAVAAWPWRRPRTANACTRSACCSRAPGTRSCAPTSWPAANPSRSPWGGRWGCPARGSG